MEKKYKSYYDNIDSILNSTTLTQQTFIELRQNFDFISEMSMSELNEYIRNMTEEERKIILLAKMFIGQIPYQWGGKAEMRGYNSSWWTYDENGEQRGLDCSGFVQWIYMTAGYSPDIQAFFSFSTNPFRLKKGDGPFRVEPLRDRLPLVNLIHHASYR